MNVNTGFSDPLSIALDRTLTEDFVIAPQTYGRTVTDPRELTTLDTEYITQVKLTRCKSIGIQPYILLHAPASPLP